MPRRRAIVTQADVARTIRAMVDAGLTVVRCVTRPDGVAVETTNAPAGEDAPPAVGERKPIVL